MVSRPGHEGVHPPRPGLDRCSWPRRITYSGGEERLSPRRGRPLTTCLLARFLGRVALPLPVSTSGCSLMRGFPRGAGGHRVLPGWGQGEGRGLPWAAAVSVPPPGSPVSSPLSAGAGTQASCDPPEPVRGARSRGGGRVAGARGRGRRPWESRAVKRLVRSLLRVSRNHYHPSVFPGPPASPHSSGFAREGFPPPSEL